jgi:oligopeptidase B
MGSGHFGPSGRYEGIREVAFDYAFLLDTMGLASTSQVARRSTA